MFKYASTLAKFQGLFCLNPSKYLYFLPIFLYPLSVCNIEIAMTDPTELEKELIESENRFLAITSLTPDAIIIVNAQQQIVFFSTGAEQIFGYTRSEAVGQPLNILLPPRYLETHSAHIQNFSKQSETLRPMSSRQTTLYGRNKNGLEFPIEVTISKWKNQGEHVFAALVRNITDRLRNEETIHRLAYYDSLSGLPSRFQFIEKLQKVIKTVSENKRGFLSVLLLDLSRFQEINQSLGSAYGDALIKGVAQRIIENIGEHDFAARMGGDEFGIILESDSNEASSLAEKLCEAMKIPFEIENFPLVAEASIGIALFPEHAITPEGLIQKGEVALFNSKQLGIDYSVYDTKKDPFINSKRLTLLGELAKAIDSNQLFLLYQPKIDLRTGKIIGVESLIRWKHPKRGLIPPSDFISSAENTDLIKSLTLFVIKEALKQFQTLFNLGKNLNIGINISTRNLHDPVLPGQIVKMLIANKITPESLELEITENAIMEYSESAQNVIQLLQRAGINLTIDEFGIGYSSLNILKKLPIRSLKIPRAFIKEISSGKEDLKIVRSIIDLAHTLELKVTAVGVEDKQTLQKLIELGCDSAQGHYMSPPITIKEVFGMMFKPLEHWV
jgi:diguanylate cyclase (GGDEF)-like protein/PAS domain S-box-containing protein